VYRLLELVALASSQVWMAASSLVASMDRCTGASAATAGSGAPGHRAGGGYRRALGFALGGSFTRSCAGGVCRTCGGRRLMDRGQVRARRVIGQAASASTSPGRSMRLHQRAPCAHSPTCYGRAASSATWPAARLVA
jgi:hypothetical protein